MTLKIKKGTQNTKEVQDGYKKDSDTYENQVTKYVESMKKSLDDIKLLKKD